MIFINELDVYLRSFFYWINFNFYSQNFNLSEQVKTWKHFIDTNRGYFKSIELSADAFGFMHNVAWARATSGEKEIRTRRMKFYLPFNGLRVYPRLFYSEGYLPKPPDFEKHRYCFTYYPKVLMPRFEKTEKKKWEVILTQHWMIGTYRYLKKSLIIYLSNRYSSFNVRYGGKNGALRQL